MENLLLNNQWAKKEISGEVRKYFEMNENEDTVAEFMDTVKAVSEGNFHPEMPILKKKYLKSGT